MNGYFLHPRCVIELYIKKPSVLAVCEAVLFSTRYKACVQKGIEVGGGQCLMTLQELSDMCAVSISQVRTALKTMADDGGIRLENMGKCGILITLLPAFSCEDENRRAPSGRGNGGYGKSTYKKSQPQPDPDASYDLARAEARAKAGVPKLQKRKRR